MAEKILVTGATGFVGTHLVQTLVAQGNVVCTHSTQRGDIARDLLACEGVGHVYHLAAKTFVPESWEAPTEFYNTNVLGTVNVLEFCRRRGASLTYVSSYVYGNPDALPISEDHPRRAFNPYSHTKIVAEDIVHFYGACFGVRTVVVRPFNIYGPGQEKKFLIPTLIRQAIDPACEYITVADLRPRRDYIHVQDLIALLLSCRGATAGAVYNAGSGRSCSIEELIEMIQGLTGQIKPVRSKAERRPDEVLDVVADITRARNELQWTPQIALADGLRETVAWCERDVVR